MTPSATWAKWMDLMGKSDKHHARAEACRQAARLFRRGAGWMTGALLDEAARDEERLSEEAKHEAFEMKRSIPQDAAHKFLQIATPTQPVIVETVSD